MPRFILEKLTVFIIVFAVILVPFSSVARDVASGKVQGSCTFLLMAADCCADNPSQQPDNYPGDNSGDCCDSEGCAQDAAAPPAACRVKVHSSVTQLFSTDGHSHIPAVYLAIFVPPER